MIIIVFTQVLLKYFIIDPLMVSHGINETLPGWVFGLLSLSTILIAGGGYVINDVFDVKIDQVNKPADKMVGKYISATKAENFYWTLTAAGILTGFMAGVIIDYINFVFIYILTALLLWFYSSSLKKLPVVGNLVIAFLSALSFYLVWLAELFYGNFLSGPYDAPVIGSILVWGYTAFAFIINILREIIKDIEDLEGDKYFGGRTLPVIIGVQATRYIAIGIAVFVFLMSIGAQYLMGIAGWYVMFGYFVILIQLPLVILMIILSKAGQKRHFDNITKLTKLVMITGVVSMPVACYSIGCV
ncbi:MAG: geranylgeranylglycerol-phosphate geranylgeranyltransferase [Bacteroidales bacterium]|nr:geranylgeranylglycerol-phosphate geranylgeranyltransferase [Bacteroidales bacterium]MCF8334112.1 geranylgeranylglycerol-phosphate geranylgeranyltransferase [Bacteroidales bacterium]